MPTGGCSPAKEAYEIGFVDELGDFDDARARREELGDVTAARPT